MKSAIGSWALALALLGCGDDEESSFPTAGSDSGESMGDASAPSSLSAEDGSTGGSADSTSGNSSMDDSMSMSAGSSMSGATTMGNTTTSTGGGVTSNTTNDSLDDGGVCAPPECTSYTTKMQSCYPGLGTDWYGTCLEVYDICDIGGDCFDGVPNTIQCALSSNCDVIVDGGCVGDDPC